MIYVWPILLSVLNFLYNELHVDEGHEIYPDSPSMISSIPNRWPKRVHAPRGQQALN